MGKRRLRVLAAASAALLAATVVAGCGGRDDDSGGGGDGGGDKSLTIGYIPWDEDIAVSYLWQHILEEKGYDVELKQLDVAPTFVGLSQGDIDLFFDTWLPITHEDYWKQYGDEIEDLGVWYDHAKLTIAVPDYVDATTIGDLKGMESTFDGTITGIESGAGLTRVTKEEAIPTYGLDDYTLRTSSTTAMLAALKKATDAQEPIVVTLWRPHWAYAAFPIKDLEDPEGAMGEAEEIHVVARDGFSDDQSEVAGWLKEFEMDDEHLGTLEQTVLQEHADDPEAGVEAWVKDNQDYVDTMTDGTS